MNLDCMSPAPPTYAVNKHKSAAFVSAGRQGGVRSSKNALEPLVDVVDDKLTHLTKSLELAAEVRQPYNNPDPIDDDMEFAITQTIGYSHCLRKTRDALMGHILEIKNRCTKMNTSLVAKQPASVRLAASSVDVGLMAVLMTIIFSTV